MGTWSLMGNALGAGTGFLGTTDNNALVIKTGMPAAERLRVDTSGNVGIGTATPQKPLDIAGSGGIRISQVAQASSQNEVYFADNGQIRSLDDNHRIIFNRSTNDLELREYGTITFSPGAIRGQRTAMVVIDNSGNVGIGTATPQKPLDVGSVYLPDGSVNGGIRINRTDAASSLNELFFNDNGQVRSADDNHRIIFNRTANDLELREYGTITLSPGATQGQRTAMAIIDPSGELTLTPPSGGDWSAVCFANKGEIRCGPDTTHRIIFERDANNLEFVEYGAITFSPGATKGQSTARVVIDSSGNLNVAGDVLLTGADCAEHFDMSGAQPLEPGTVVVIDEDGALSESRSPYDKKVAGVVSGAGDYRHGLVLDNRPSEEGRVPVGLVGKVYCKADAQYSPVEVGDLLTTSPTPGHAMKATDPQQAFGAIIGKALKALPAGAGLIPILIALQ